MREIKFRAWDKENKKFFKPIFEAYNGKIEELILTLNGRLQIRTLNNLIDESMFPDRFELMQFTGLKDKNGKEIYEGDIVKEYEYYGTIVGTFVDIVRYDSKIACFVIGKDERDFFLDLPEYDYEVIGNIYENPELVQNETK